MPSSFLFSWTDVVLVVLVGIFAFAGWKSGFVKMSFRLLSFLAAIVLAWLFYPTVTAFLRTTPLYDTLFSALGGSAADPAAAPNAALTPDFLLDAMNQGIQTFENGAAEYLALLLLNILSFLLVLIAAKLILILAGRILHLFASLPVIGFFNRLAGLVLGLLEGFLVACILLALIWGIAPLRENTYLNYAIEQSSAAKVLYLNNPLLRLVLPQAKQTDDNPPPVQTQETVQY